MRPPRKAAAQALRAAFAAGPKMPALAITIFQGESLHVEIRLIATHGAGRFCVSFPQDRPCGRSPFLEDRRMIAFAGASSPEAQFIALLPAIRRQARVAFRGEPAERRGELVAEVIANCWVAFRRLVERGLAHVA